MNPTLTYWVWQHHISQKLASSTPRAMYTCSLVYLCIGPAGYGSSSVETAPSTTECRLPGVPQDRPWEGVLVNPEILSVHVYVTVGAWHLITVIICHMHVHVHVGCRGYKEKNMLK